MAADGGNLLPGQRAWWIEMISTFCCRGDVIHTQSERRGNLLLSVVVVDMTVNHSGDGANFFASSKMKNRNVWHVLASGSQSHGLRCFTFSCVMRYACMHQAKARAVNGFCDNRIQKMNENNDETSHTQQTKRMKII